MNNQVKTTNINYILENSIKDIKEFFSKDSKLKNFLAFAGKISPQLSLINLRYLYFKRNTLSENKEIRKPTFSIIKTLSQWHDLNIYANKDEKPLYLFTPINNKATNEITFSAMKVYDISQTSYKNYKAKKWDENSFKEAIFTLFKDYSIKWIDDIEMQGAKLAIDNLSKYIFINKNYKKWENYLILHEYAHQLANHSSNDRKDILKEYQIIKACEMFINSLEFENEFYKQAYPRYENMQVLTVIKSLSNKEKYKVLDEILTIGYKLIDKFSSSDDILKDEIYG
ncbi:Mbov_0389 family ICE element HExxH motif-containing protein [Mycoplasmopsis bovis]|uniref:Uncharacterized protein n=5 Tax=Mycoplasmopsis bovis TaxID=28903 RepID=A0A454APV6_MYCBG|nr:hypothetical protein [Mycoplasmopsis bovis]ADR25090.1 conserved hypothetical protein (ICEB-1 encoded) [Mycoplasmopsis bovis PG45]MBT1322193.1 hypothetical protein [Mycoplasmopsis bovis]MBT1325140.1 hypothetical protein [Mycoplasmopsis bovis]MBT1334957.1 hypothetical protein [Mycoplasmopsis bovis]MBT1343530.1 hypothetical protein [Mycoplasmopsis bovis]